VNYRRGERAGGLFAEARKLCFPYFEGFCCELEKQSLDCMKDLFRISDKKNSQPWSGLPDFSSHNIPKWEKYTK
jgi:hypothetical protein